jgi:hypothetical protein
MTPHINEQPLIPAFSPYEGEKENVSLVWSMRTSWIFAASEFRGCMDESLRANSSPSLFC